MSDHWTDRLSEYLDGELRPAERSALEAHLSGCQECQVTLAELRRVVARAQALEDEPPAHDLWPAIGRQIGRRPEAVVDLAARRAQRRFAFTVPQLAAAALVLMLGSAAVVRLMVTPPSPTQPALAPAVPTVPPFTPVAAVRGAHSYDAAIAEFEAVLAQHRSQLDTSTIRVIEKSLATIDRAIAEARTALEADPASPYLNQHLARTMRRKLDLLRQVSALVAEPT